jgi:hypothetical protein
MDRRRRPGEPIGGIPCLIEGRKVAEIYLGLFLLISEHPEIGPDLRSSYIKLVNELIERAASLNILHHVAQEVYRSPNPKALDYFDRTINIAQLKQGEISHSVPKMITFSFGNPGSIPIELRRPMIPLDPCEWERWSLTQDMIRCLNILQAQPKYDIQDAINITKSTPKETIHWKGCIGDEIEILGENFGEEGSVIFRIGVYTAASFWSDNMIRVRIPERAESGRLGLYIPVEVPECVIFARRSPSRRPAWLFDFSTYFQVIENPQILEFSANGDQGIVEAEACTNVTIKVMATSVETAVIKDGAGTVVWDSGTGDPREIDHSFTVNLQESENYTLEVRNFCMVITENLQLDIYHAIHLSANPAQVETNSNIQLVVGISCPAPPGGVIVNLLSSKPDALPVPEDVTIIEGSNEQILELHTGGHCSLVQITGTSQGYITGIENIRVISTPVILGITPTSIDACSPFVLEITGNCFAPATGYNTVRISNENQTIELDIIDIITNPTDPTHGVVLRASGDNLRPGTFQVRVISYGLVSAPYGPINIASVPATINSFGADPSEFGVCVGGQVELSWGVSNTNEVRIDGSSDGTLVTRPYSSCGNRSGSQEVSLSRAQTLTLRAFPFGGGPPATRTLDISENLAGAFSQFRIDNKISNDVLTIWRHDLTTNVYEEIDDIVFEEWVIINLLNCHMYRLIAVSLAWVNAYNNSYNTNHDPHNLLTAQTANFQRAVVPGSGQAFWGRGTAPTGYVEVNVDGWEYK